MHLDNLMLSQDNFSVGQPVAYFLKMTKCQEIMVDWKMIISIFYNSIFFCVAPIHNKSYVKALLK